MEIFAITPIVFKGLVRTSCGGVHSNKTKLDFYSKFKYKSSMNDERLSRLDTMDEIAFRELKAENKRLKKRAQEAEGEVTIVKGIGQNSPEMKALAARVKQLESSLTRCLEINESHQKYKGQLQIRLTEVEQDNKKLAHQIEDKVNQLRKSGMM